MVVRKESQDVNVRYCDYCGMKTEGLYSRCDRCGKDICSAHLQLLGEEDSVCRQCFAEGRRGLVGGGLKRGELQRGRVYPINENLPDISGVSDSADSIRQEIADEEKKLRDKKEYLARLERDCRHDWGETKYVPEHRKALGTEM